MIIFFFKANFYLLYKTFFVLVSVKQRHLKVHLKNINCNSKLEITTLKLNHLFFRLSKWNISSLYNFHIDNYILQTCDNGSVYDYV